MSGLSQNTLQNEAVRNQYNSMVMNAIKTEDIYHIGQPNNTIQSFGALYAMREEMQDQVGFGRAYLNGGMNFSSRSRRDDDCCEGNMSILETSIGKGKDAIHIDINSHKNEPNDDEKPEPKRKRGGKKCGGKAVSGADFSGADVINSQPLKNQGPKVGKRASLGNRMPNNNAGAGVQSWTEAPNKSLSNQDIKEATATTRDIQNGFPVANEPTPDLKKRRIRKKKATTSRQGGAAVASPDIDEGKMAPVVPGIIPATQIDGFQDPRTTGMTSQASKPFDTASASAQPSGSGKKKRNRKPMTAEQKKAFAERMKQAKMKKRKQT